MAASVIGALKVVLGGDNSGLDKSLKDSQGALSSFGSKLALGFAAVSAAAIGAATALGLQVKSAIDNADQLNKMSQSTGVSTEELSKLKYAADLADVSSEALGKSIGKLSKALVSAGTDGAGQAARAFAAMGIEVKNQDGTLRSSSDVLKDIADKFAGYKDGAEKTALAIALFGKGGAALIPLLNAGRDGLEEAAAEAEKFGIVLDKKTTMAAEAFNDNLKKMDVIKQGLVTTIAAKLLPSLEQLSMQMLDSRKNSDLLNVAADAMVSILKFVINEVVTTVVWFQRLGVELGALGKFLAAPWGEVGKAWADFQAEGDKTEQMLKGLKTSLSDVWAAATKSGDASSTWTEETLVLRGLNREVMSYGDAWKQTAPIVGEAATNTKNALQKFLDAQAKSAAGHTAEAETIGKSVGEQAKLKLAYEAEQIALANKIPLNAANNLLITQAGDAAALAAMKVAGANATVAAMNPAQQFAQQMDQLRQLYDAGVISLETYGARQQQIAEAAGATWDIASASMAGSFATIAKSFGKEGSAMAKAAQVFGIIQGTISMYTGAAKALELPFPANIAAMAAVLAKGAQMVASIKSQSVPTGMMTGGSMMVRGGGGPDSTPVSIMASPGEQIDVWRPDQGGGADPRRGAGGGNTVNLSMPIATTRDALRGLIEGLNDMFADGYRLNVVAA